ncbi:hypothetical protein [Priestia endophytica]|uniref:hypothetical protein n=1 Tax=Priestia endophytica TaxID=135735 RepID=UPI000F52537B|nr:hypothetical protein [Priestia endophytica]RPK08295.1 hypothetical protein FH5_04925 [Priestia endophytica]
MNETYIPAIITASVALIAAIGVQFLNNRLTYKREEKKYLRECYQNLFGPIYSKLWSLIHIEITSHYRPEYEEEWKKIFKMFDESKKYASVELMETFFEINPTYRYGNERIRFAFFFFRELDLIMDSLKINSPKSKNLKKLIIALETWIMFEVEFNAYIASLSFIYRDVLPEDFLKKTRQFMKKTDPGGPRTVDDNFLRIYPYF